MGIYSEIDANLREDFPSPFSDDSLSTNEAPFADTDLPVTAPFAADNNNSDSPFDDVFSPPAHISSVVQVAKQSPSEPPVSPAAQTIENQEDSSPPDDAAETRRMAEQEAERKAKIQAELEKIAQLNAMSDDKVMDAAVQRIGTDTERLTHRNMKVCVSEHIQAKCLDEPDFARLVLHPRKNMTHCFWYIYRKAMEYAEQEMKDNQEKPQNGVYGTDVPDGLCYQWAEEYFRDPDAKEDQEKPEKITPKTTSSKTSAKGTAKKNPVKKNVKNKAVASVSNMDADKGADNGEQLSLLGIAG